MDNLTQREQEGAAAGPGCGMATSFALCALSTTPFANTRRRRAQDGHRDYKCSWQQSIH